MKKALLVLLSALLLPTVVGCEEGPAERAGEKINEAANDVSDAAEDAADKIEDAAN